jgi:hypothetical protein
VRANDLHIGVDDQEPVGSGRPGRGRRSDCASRPRCPRGTAHGLDERDRLRPRFAPPRLPFGLLGSFSTVRPERARRRRLLRRDGRRTPSDETQRRGVPASRRTRTEARRASCRERSPGPDPDRRPVLDRPRWVADPDLQRRHVPRYDRAGADSGPCSDLDERLQGRVDADLDPAPISQWPAITVPVAISQSLPITTSWPMWTCFSTQVRAPIRVGRWIPASMQV